MRYYICFDTIYTDYEISNICNKSVTQINKEYDLGLDIRINNIPIVISKITENKLPWIINQSKYYNNNIYSSIGIPINIEAYNKLIFNV